ncbi:MAG: class I SAM-dependent methyltransferase [Corynebacteriales bacterium]|nr:class I SAM-dependent methyltransferase [Mycobacteriales bacterium]
MPPPPRATPRIQPVSLGYFCGTPYSCIAADTPTPHAGIVNSVHYFSAQPTAPSAPRTITFELPDGKWTLTTDTGVFSYGELDPGTRILLEKAPAPHIPGPILDLGCGAGPIAAVWARREPNRELIAVDVNERALELCRTNTREHPNVTALRPEAVDPGIKFAAIYSNPPIKVGKAVLHSMLEEWLVRLLPDGSAYLVVSKHLGADSLSQWLAEKNFDVNRIASRKGYRIIQAKLTS